MIHLILSPECLAAADASSRLGCEESARFRWRRPAFGSAARVGPLLALALALAQAKRCPGGQQEEAARNGQLDGHTHTHTQAEVGQV